MSTLLGIVGVVLLLLFTFAMVGCTGPHGGGGKSQVTGPPVVLSPDQIEVLDRAAIRALLERAAKTRPPDELKMGAMCYSMAAPPERADYLCPECGGRTLYEQGMAREVEWELPYCRREFEKLKKVAGDAVSLNESQFCRECSPDAQNPQLVLNVTYRDGRRVTVSPVHADDICLLREFLSGELVHKGERDDETAMKDLLPRLEEMLGVKRR